MYQAYQGVASRPCRERGLRSEHSASHAPWRRDCALINALGPQLRPSPDRRCPSAASLCNLAHEHACRPVCLMPESRQRVHCALRSEAGQRRRTQHGAAGRCKLRADMPFQRNGGAPARPPRPCFCPRRSGTFASMLHRDGHGDLFGRQVADPNCNLQRLVGRLLASGLSEPCQPLGCGDHSGNR